MAVDDLNPADIQALVDVVAGDPEGPDHIPASIDPSDLNLPGAWVVLDGIGGGTLAGVDLTCRVFLIAPNVVPTQALAILAPLYNTAKARLQAAGIQRNGTTTTELVVVPGTESQPLPALSIPVLFTTSQDEE